MLKSIFLSIDYSFGSVLAGPQCTSQSMYTPRQTLWLTTRRKSNPSAQKPERLRPLESIARVKPPAPGMLPSIPVLDEIRDKPGRGRELPFVEAVLVCIIKAAKNQWE